MANADAPARPGWTRWISPLFLIVLGVTLAATSWRTWGDVLVDLGRELYLPWRLVEGDVLYRDVESFNGPLSPYWNALLFRVFGTGYQTLVWANLSVLAVATVLWVRLLAAWTGTYAATAAGAIFLAVFGFGSLIYIGCFSWLAPYSHEMTHGLVLSLASLSALARAQRARPALWGGLSGLCAGLVFLTKAEVFLGLLAGIGAGSLVLLRHHLPRGRRLAYCGALALGAVLPVALSYVLLNRQLSAADAWRGTLGSFVHIGNREISALLFYRATLGVDEPLANLGRLVRWLAIDALVLLPGLWLAFRCGRTSTRNRLVVAGLVSAAIAIGLYVLRQRLDMIEVARPFPVFLIVAVVLWVRRCVQEERWEVIPAAVLFFALGLLAKVILNVPVAGYGFGLAFPAAGVMTVLLLGPVPAWLERKGASGLVFQVVALGFLIGVSSSLVRRSYAMVGRQPFVTGEGVDWMHTDLRGKLVNPTLQHLQETVGPDETILVLPEGVMLNYLTRRRSPTPFINFMPPELILFGEGRMLADLRRNPPAVVVIAHKDTSEYGLQFFGVDYGQAIMSWVRQNYERRILYGEEPLVSNLYGVDILVPRDSKRAGEGR